MVDDRSKVAAATASVVPFHCIVCFDEFSVKERPPVVLPCGHTYICAPCSKRIKRCMECREPLYYTVKPSTSSNNNSTNTTTFVPRVTQPAPSMYGRHSPITTPSTPPQSSSSYSVPMTQLGFVPPPIQIPCAIPKNVVLISMMEAAERQAQQQCVPNDSYDRNDSQYQHHRDDTNGSMNASDEDEQYDLNRIISGMSTFAGPCGTYAVKDVDGLVISSIDPNDDDENDDDDDDDTDHDVVSSPKIHVTASYDSIEMSKPNTIQRGQTVQVVRFDNGVAKLARNAGYIVANSSQLVKVGGPLETTCRLEGLLDTVISRGKDLQRELEENYRIEEAIRREIALERQVEPNHPIITDIPILSSDCISPSLSHNDKSFEPTTPDNAKQDSIHQPYIGTPNNESPVTDVHPTTKSTTDIRQYDIAHSFPHIPNAMMDDQNDFHTPGLPGYRTRQTSSFDESMYDYGCGAAGIFTSTSNIVPSHHHENAITDGLHGHSNGNNSSHNNYNGYGNPNQRFNSISSDVHQNHHHHHHDYYGGPTLSSSFDTIDFRTGMSGHRGLNHSKLHPGHSPTPRAGSRFMMSEHRGIGRVRGPLQRLTPFNTAPSS